MKIQLEPGPSSAATHRLTRPSSTLNRRYVSRPTNLAIEEVAKSATQNRQSNNSLSAPSRLVNMHVHDADLAAIRASEAEARFKSECQASIQPITASAVNFGVVEDMPQNTVSQNTHSYNTQSNSESFAPAPIAEAEVAHFSSLQPLSNNAPEYASMVDSTYQSSQSSSLSSYPNSSSYATVSTSPSTSSDIDTKALAMSIAADYTAASLGATMTEVSNHNIYDTSDKLSAAINEQQATSSIDEIARTASEAIASIRAATDPTDIANQISALKKFAEDIKTNSTMPEITELGDTIEKFITIAVKSTGIKTELNAKKPALSPKASRAAAKVTKSSAKIITSNKTAQLRSATLKNTKPPVQRKISTTASKPTLRRTITPNGARRTARTSSRNTYTDNEDLALRRALRSVAAIENDEDSSQHIARQPIRRRGNGKRFILAFCCATACVAAIIYFVSTNIPDVSVRVAALQTGVEASYPAYLPSGFSLNSIDSENGKITLTFNGSDGQSFTLIEEKSSWDSTTLQRNYAEPTWGNDYTTTHEQGITVYMSGSSAAWVNGGVLYKINAGVNTLTKKQLRNIVTSMQ